MKKVGAVLTMCAMALVACGDANDGSEPGPTTEAAQPEEGAMGGMPMEGMAGMDAPGGMMSEMQAHMQAMDGVGGAAMMQNMPQHRQMLANMIAQMNREMGDMGVPANEAWRATIDSLRQDLIQMPELTGTEVESFMPAHRDRVMRLIEMHEAMMAGMSR